jgi:hypothetical protein
MNRKPIMGALVAAATLLAAGAYAQNPNAAPQGKANAADKAEKAGDKAEKKAEKAADKVEKAADKAADKADKAADKADLAGDKAKSVEDRAARKAKEHDAQREKLKGMLKAPMDSATREELRRHAERLARLERIRSVATTEKDNATADKVTSLVAKENARHETWMTKHVTTAQVGVGTPGATPQPAAVPPTNAKDEKGGAK